MSPTSTTFFGRPSGILVAYKAFINLFAFRRVLKRLMFGPPALWGSARINARQTQEVPVRELPTMGSQECKTVSLTKQVGRGSFSKWRDFISIKLRVSKRYLRKWFRILIGLFIGKNGTPFSSTFTDRVIVSHNEQKAKTFFLEGWNRPIKTCYVAFMMRSNALRVLAWQHGMMGWLGMMVKQKGSTENSWVCLKI